MDYLQDNHMTTYRFAKESGIPQSTIWSILKKEDYEVREKNIRKICKAMGISAGEIMESKEEVKRNLRAGEIPVMHKYRKLDESDHFCSDGFGKRKVTELRYSDVLNFYLSLIDKGIKVKSVKSLHCVLHPAFDMAVRDDIIRKNPSDGVLSEVRKRQGRKMKVQRALTLEQHRELLDYVTGHPLYDYWRPLFTVLLGTGCRIGEICGLRWQDVDMENHVIDINHSMTYFRRGKKAPYTLEFKAGPPKTKAGIRKIPMLDAVYEVLKELYDERKKNGISPLVVDGMTDFIFINKAGSLYKHSAIDHSIRRIVNNHNAEEEIRAKKSIENRLCYLFSHVTPLDILFVPDFVKTKQTLK